MAPGGELAYKVKDGSFPGFFFGMVSLAGGLLGGVLLGGLDMGLGSDMFGTGGDVAFMGAGAGLAVVGIVLLASLAFGDADLISVDLARGQFSR